MDKIDKIGVPGNWKNRMEEMASISLMDSLDYLMEKSTKLQRRYF